MSGWTTVRGKEVAAGDLIKVAGRAQRIETIEPYRHPEIDTPARLVYWIVADGRDGMTVFDTDLVDVSR